MITVVELVGYPPGVWSPCLADQATDCDDDIGEVEERVDYRRLQIHDIECHHTTGGFDVRVVDIAAMDSDYCNRGVQCVAVHRVSAP